MGRSRLCEVDVFFFFSSRRRHTRFDCDWSSDVCSSDLLGPLVLVLALGTVGLATTGTVFSAVAAQARLRELLLPQIGRASCRERGVDLGGRRIIKKKKRTHTGEREDYRKERDNKPSSAL